MLLFMNITTTHCSNPPIPNPPHAIQTGTSIPGTPERSSHLLREIYTLPGSSLNPQSRLPLAVPVLASAGQTGTGLFTRQLLA